MAGTVMKSLVSVMLGAFSAGSALAIHPALAATVSNAVPATALPTGGQDFHAILLGWNATDPAPKSGDIVEMPVNATHLSSPFGIRHDPLGKGPRAHLGIDIPDASGAPVRAAARGVIVFAGWSPGYGNLVQIDHGAGNETRYGHLKSISVSVGELVQQGTTIGAVGSTGRSTGPHLHFEVRQDGLAVDPLSRLGTRFANAVSVAMPAQQRWAGFTRGDDALPQSRLR